MKILAVLLKTFFIIALCRGSDFKYGGCPKVVVMNNLDFDRFSGIWYVIQRYSPKATCTKIIFEKAPDGTYTMNETGRLLGLNSNTFDTKTRKIEFLRNDSRSVFRAEKNITHFTLSTFGVIDTNYVMYAIVWGCDPFLFASVQNIDIMSRIPIPSKDLVKNAERLLKDLSIDYSSMKNVDQSNCTELPSTTTSSSKDTNNIVIASNPPERTEKQ
ncbi:uncharacterized protein [Parasteatoda tepidariorum]|uniref:uncharacterized protein n=1 Tax=Parasteatoda tepidariorum TaxID=114398 RepID=UPI00077FBCE9|nr:apolipoprotein D-like [Parasteatoda tepidariorum]